MSHIIARIDGSVPTANDNGHGIGPVSKAGALGVALAGVLAGVTVAVLAVFGIVLDPALVLAGTTLLGVGLNLLFGYFTPSKKIIEVVEVIAKEDLDSDGIIGSSQGVVQPSPNEPPIV